MRKRIVYNHVFATVSQTARSQIQELTALSYGQASHARQPRRLVLSFKPAIYLGEATRDNERGGRPLQIKCFRRVTRSHSQALHRSTIQATGLFLRGCLGER